MKLKLIETNDSPKIGDLVTNPKNGLIRIASETTLVLHSGLNHLKVVLPYGINDEEIKDGLFLVSNSIYQGVFTFMEHGLNSARGFIVDSNGGLHNPEYCKKVSILPEQFKYQEIVDLGLKDGDELNGYFHMPFDGKVAYEISLDSKQNTLFHITKPTPVTYTEEEVYTLLNKLNQEIMEAEDSRYMENDSVTQWFNLNKKKQ
jgi:hypothetical protein